MNAERRKMIAKAVTMLDEARGLIEAARDEEQDFYDNMPESFQSGEKGDKATEAISYLEDAMGNAESAISDLENIE